MTKCDPIITASKAEARKAAAAVRSVAHKNGQTSATGMLNSVLAAYHGHVLAGYMPMRSEIDPLPAMTGHHGPVCVPVIKAPHQPLLFREWTPDAAMVQGTFGVVVPAAGAWLVPQVLIVPLLAFDARGYRLGYGGGFYDRTLASLRAKGPVIAIGFAFAAQQVPQVPIGSLDQPLDIVVTEAGIVVP